MYTLSSADFIHDRRQIQNAGESVSGGDDWIIDRRKLLRGSLIASGLLLSGFEKSCWAVPAQAQDSDPFRGGSLLGVVDFSEEGQAPMGEALGAELDGRLFTDLSKLTPENPIIPTSTFYIRTRASKLLDATKPWSIPFGGLIEKPFSVSVPDLEKMARPMGMHLMECAGNARLAHFGMLSAAEWEGVQLEGILEGAKSKLPGARVLISGFDQYATESISSVPGASWIFTLDQLKSSRAFLATKMNGQPLTPDHGSPVRLVAPGWYGCTCVKWVNEISLVNEDAAATSQMREYASRTMQTGVPRLAKDYQPASLDPAAMPVRIEKWLVGEKIKYRVAGIQWGGSRPVDGLEIRFNPEEEYIPVESLRITSSNSWNFWSHAWAPQKPGKYLIRLRLKGANTVTRRLDSGYYMRSVEITEI
jgi:DMSO/TMAO reductase YedYZ molybdopterin-dependent catalytic subunit